MDRICFKVNGVEHSVGCEVSSEVMLLDYIRTYLQLKGTKYMCRQAGCGACIVAASKCHGSTPESVNSCMVPITSCHNWEITTIEAVGNRKKGYHILQETLAKYNGTQCGYCSPGWIMSMYSLLQKNKYPTMLEIERSFGSNICRCTGYRSILDAFKSFAKDAPKDIRITDIEDLSVCDKTVKHCNKSCDLEEWCILSKDELEDRIIEIKLNDGRSVYKVNKVIDIITLFRKEGRDSYQLVAGNTARGVYPTDVRPRLLIDITGIEELKGYITDQNLVIGSGNTLTELLNIFKDFSKTEGFRYLQTFYDHLSLVAHIPVRNIGTIAGNLMIKHKHNDFPSDLYLMFETVGAQITVLNYLGTRRTVTMQQFLSMEMKGSIILNIMLPPFDERTYIITFKVMPRSQNAHAIVNAGFLYKLSNSLIVVRSTVVFSGLTSNFSRASATARFLEGKPLFTNETLQGAIAILNQELTVTEIPPEPSASYRKRLALGLFYKGLLSLCPTNKLNARYRSGAIRLNETRPVSKGSQIFDTDPTLWPLNQPIPKIEALIQCAGEARYTEDIPSFPREVYGSFVLSTIPVGYIASIDPSKALKMIGVIAFYSAKDIPGTNSFTPTDDPINTVNEEVLCSGEIKYFNQPLGIIVAKTQYLAELAAKAVSVKYSNIKKPVIDIKEAKKEPKRNVLYTSIDAKRRDNDVAKVIKGSNTVYGQYHFMLETMVCVTRPTEEGVEVYATSQLMDAVQVMISRALKMDANRIDVHVRRLGGAFGIKISRTTQVAVACCLVVQKLNIPCRFILPMTTNTRAFGKRFPCSANFEVGVSKSGVIQYANYNVYEDNGYTINEKLTDFGVSVFSNCYDSSTWNYKVFDTLTDTAKNTFFRAPGTLESIASAEFIVERIAYELALDPLQVRLANLDSNYNELKEMLEGFVEDVNYTQRRVMVDKFNSENRWKKRGLRFTLFRWVHEYPRYFEVNMSVYHEDGTVSLTHGGIEIGQGINTKAAQICAYFLKIPLEMIQVKATNTIISPNCAVTGGSITSQNIGIGVERSCKELLARLEPIKRQMNSPTWKELIKKAFESNVDLQSHGFVNMDDMSGYNVYGVTLAEVEVDIITGESEILKVDILEDVGQSVSPEIDIGQVEGAFVQGIGYWKMEKLVYDENTGELLTDRTWNYYVPQARDIPQDMKVYFRKKSYSNRSILGSKAVGEPPICMSVVVPLAIREAIASARLESGIPTTKWFDIDGPYTTEEICMSAQSKLEEFKYE